ncbi:MAG: hypothetical protein JSV43_01650 [Methanobacteriota archaeon]|nr:MAG: hypothetical protein JSV43_01650 [Euryarchaeota archaeon]
MPYKLVKGEFHLYYRSTRHVGSQPDGDSIWFKPNDPLLLSGIGGRSVEFNNGGFAQLRFEAIDALELHYKGAEQNLELAFDSRDFTLGEAGFSVPDIVYAPQTFKAVRSAIPHPTKGFILTRNIDPFGRPVSFVFAGTTNKQDGNEYWLDTTWLNDSINAALARSGNAYPSFYTGLPTDLRNRIRDLVRTAQKPPKMIWKPDLSTKGFRAPSLEKLEELVIWPKLFRRLITFFNDGKTDLGDFDEWIRASSTRDDEVWIISEAELGNMHDVIVYEEKKNKMFMKYAPKELIIVPR